MFLNSTTDINTVVNWVNTNGAGMISPEVFYSKQLLDTIRLDANQYTYYRYADDMPIQDKADKLTVRRWSPLQAHTVPLAEGVPPLSDKGSVEKYEMQAYQYGRYMEFTDKVNFKVVDPVVAHYSQEYSIVAIETLDLLAQETLLTVAQKYFAGMAANASKLTLNSKPSIADLRVIGLALKKSLVKPRSNGRYHVIVSPEFTFDMLDDDYVQNYMKINQTTKQMYDNGSLIPMFGFEFYEVMNCPEDSVFYTVGEGGVRSYFIVEYQERAGVGEAAPVAGAGETIVADTGSSTGYYAYKNKTVTPVATTAGYVNDGRTGQAASYIPSYAATTRAAINAVAAADSGWSVLKVQHTLILGKDALAKTGLAGEQNAKMYVKGLGSAGVLDPIDQRQSIGFKINSVGFASVRLEAVVDYINVPSQLNV